MFGCWDACFKLQGDCQGEFGDPYHDLHLLGLWSTGDLLIDSSLSFSFVFHLKFISLMCLHQFDVELVVFDFDGIVELVHHITLGGLT